MFFFFNSLVSFVHIFERLTSAVRSSTIKLADVTVQLRTDAKSNQGFCVDPFSPFRRFACSSSYTLSTAHSRRAKEDGYLVHYTRHFIESFLFTTIYCNMANSLVTNGDALIVLMVFGSSPFISRYKLLYLLEKEVKAKVISCFIFCQV